MSEENINEHSLPADFKLEIRGWPNADEAAAKLFGEQLMALTKVASCHLDLSPLMKIVVGLDYQEALLSVQPEDNPRDVATANEFGEGAAMALTVREGDGLRKVVVLWLPLIQQVFDPTDPLASASLQSFMHELVHVDDHAHLDQTFPGGAAATIARDDLHGALLEIVMPARAEYDATRRTAHYEAKTGFQFLDMLEAVMAGFHEEVLKARQHYNLKMVELDEFWPWLQERCRFVFQALGYALGHADGVLNAEEVDQFVQQSYRDRLNTLRQSHLGWLLDETRSAVTPIYEQSTWTSLDCFDPLIAVATKLLARHGVTLSELEQGYWVHVPPEWAPPP